MYKILQSPIYFFRLYTGCFKCPFTIQKFIRNKKIVVLEFGLHHKPCQSVECFVSKEEKQFKLSLNYLLTKEFPTIFKAFAANHMRMRQFVFEM